MAQATTGNADMICEAEIPFILKISKSKGGITDPPSGRYKFEADKKVIIEAIPDTGYMFLSWSGDVPEKRINKNPLRINMDAHKTVKPKFVLQENAGAQSWLSSLFFLLFQKGFLSNL